MWKEGKSLLTCGRDIWPEALREEGLLVIHNRVWENPIFTLHKREEANSQVSKYIPLNNKMKIEAFAATKGLTTQEQEGVPEMCLLFNQRASHRGWKMSFLESGL